MSERSRDHAGVAAAVFAVAFAVYLATLAPTVFLIDSAPLTVAAWSLGNAHPPGFPLYLMLTHLVSLLPLGEVAWRTNLASAIFAALACAAMSLAVGELLPEKRSSRIIAFLGGLLLAFSHTLWGYATITEVYALNTFLICAVVWLVLRWRRTGSRTLLLAAAVVFGLALGVHHVTVGLTLAGISALVLGRVSVRTIAVAALCALLAMVTVYAYLPIAAARDPVLNWGDPDNPRDVMAHVTAKVYRSYVRTDAEAEQRADIVRMSLREFGPLGIILAVFGLVATFRGDRRLFWMLLLMIAAAFAWLAVYPITDDEDAYLLPAFVALVIAAAYGAAVLARGRVVVAALLLIVPLFAAVKHWPSRDRSDFLVARDYAMNALAGMERDSVLITGDRHLWGALLYLTEVEKVRADVEVVMYPLLIRSWYVEQLALPRRELEAYQPLLAIYEEDEERWQTDAHIRDEFQRRLDDLVMAVIADRVARGGHAYATPDVAMSEEAIDRNLVQRLKASYDLVPGGLALELMPGRGIRTIRPVPFELRGLANSREEVVTRDIVPAYVNALRLRARYLSATGSAEAAQESERLADSLQAR